MLYKIIVREIDGLNLSAISNKRKESLQPLIDFIRGKAEVGENVLLNFICTHNSRRSQFLQVWAQAMAAHFKLCNVFCFSGGTEATELYPEGVAALQSSGFKIDLLSKSNNPIYAIKFSEYVYPIIAFSKIYGHSFNAQNSFAAIMACTEADGKCPLVVGAEKRIPLAFEDPKIYDNSPVKAAKYYECSLQIAAEMFYVFSKIKK